MEMKNVIDWSKVPVDTPLMVRNNKELLWQRRYFAFYKNGFVHCWDFGATSFTLENDIKYTSSWQYAKIAMED